MFTVGPVRAWDHGPGRSVTGAREPAARRTGGSYRMPLSRWYHEGGSQYSPRSPGGPQVRPEVLVAQHT